MPKVSIIVPVYNAQKHLAECLGNLVNQTLNDIELILVNDCSTDISLKILTDCEAQFPDKVILINSDKNRGAGGARNIGLIYASGEYIGFVDSDDLVSPDMYEKLYQKADEGYDVVDCGYLGEAENIAIIRTSDALTGILDDRKRCELIASGGYLWSKIFKKSFLDSIHLTFRENCILEDCETLMLIFATAKSIGNVKEILYRYRDYDTSLSKNTDTFSYYKNAMDAIHAIYETLSPLENYSGIQTAVEYSIVHLCVSSMNVCLLARHSGSLPEHIYNAYMSRIAEYMRHFIHIPLGKNQYVRNKIESADLKNLKDLLSLY